MEEGGSDSDTPQVPYNPDDAIYGGGGDPADPDSFNFQLDALRLQRELAAIEAEDRARQWEHQHSGYSPLWEPREQNSGEMSPVTYAVIMGTLLCGLSSAAIYVAVNTATQVIEHFTR